MGRSRRPQIQRLPEKLSAIRSKLKVETFDEMIVRLGCPEISLFRSSISEYEKGVREPPLAVLLRYARLANIYLDVLVDDDLDLPAELPSKLKSAGIARIADSAED